MRGLGASALVALAATAHAQPTSGEAATVRKMFETTFGDACNGIADRDLEAAFPLESWPLTWTLEFSDTPQTARLYKLFCYVGAYNAAHVYYLASDDDWVGIQPVPFARPEFEVAYEGGDSDAAVRDILVEGMAAEMILINSEFDPETETVTDHGFWRGLGDASAVGVWRFHEGRFVLQTYDVDASYDGEIDYRRLLDFTGDGLP